MWGLSTIRAVAVNDHVIRWCGKFQRLRKKYDVVERRKAPPHMFGWLSLRQPRRLTILLMAFYKIIYEPDYSARAMASEADSALP